nr:hypothetical protein [bacterium]
MYKYYNENPLNKTEDDCVIRAISCATNKSWDYVYDYLSDIAQLEGTLLDKRDFVRNYLDRTYQRLRGIKGKVGYVSTMFPDSTLLITMNGHITCSKPDKNGIPTIYDTFDPRDREVEDVWLVK